MSGGVGGRCARHPDVAAARTCVRCGDFFCRGCADAEHPGVCASCAARLPHGIAWEDARAGRLPRRLILTLRDVLLRPRVAFPGPARALPALGFAAGCGALVASLLLIFSVTLVSTDAPNADPLRRFGAGTLALTAVVGYGAVTAAVLLFALAQSASFAAGLRIAGRTRGLARFATRASGYAQGLVVVFLLPPFVTNLLYLFFPAEALSEATRYLWFGVLFLWPVAAGRVFYGAAQGLGLPPGRASLAAAGPTLLATLPAAYASHWLATL